MVLVVQNLQPLCRGRGREAGDDGHFADGPHAAVSGEPAALDEVFVPLRVVETADYAPDCGGGCVHALLDEGGAGVGWDGVEDVVRVYHVLEVGLFFRG